MDTCVLHVRIPKSLLVKVSALAKKAQRKRADYVRVLLTEAVRRGGLAVTK